MAAKKAAKAGTLSTVTLKHLAAKVAEDHEMAKKQAEAVLGTMVDLVVKHLKKGDRIRIGGRGIRGVRQRAARNGRHPATRRATKIQRGRKGGSPPAQEPQEATQARVILSSPSSAC